MVDGVIISIITFLWLTNIPIAFLSVIRFLRNRSIYIGKDLCQDLCAPNIIFQITTRSATKTSVVKRGIDSIIDSTLNIKYCSYQISIITEDPEDLITLKSSPCDIVVVDKQFATSAIKKARALQYAVESRRRVGRNTPNYWIFHMDDESYVTTQTILSLLKFIRNNSKAIASEGPIFYPLKLESANPLTAIAESIRPFTCYDCVSQMRKKSPPLHMHGSNLLVRSDIEDAIGWNFGPTLAEDQMFGFKLFQKYGQKSMGWHGGVLLEQPPLNMKDHFMQRRRWILGSLQNIHQFPPIHRFKLMYKLVSYSVGFASGIISLILSVQTNILLIMPSSQSISEINNSISTGVTMSLDKVLNTVYTQSIIHSLINSVTPLDFGIGSLLLFSSVVWLFSYQFGLFLNLRYSKINWPKRIIFHLQTLAFCPLIGLVETFPAFCAFIEYYVRRQTNTAKKIPTYDFYVVNK